MKYFTYQLYPIEEGAMIAPSKYLPVDAMIGYQSGSLYYYYGCAEIDNLNIISQFNPVEVSKEEFDAAFAISNIGKEEYLNSFNGQ